MSKMREKIECFLTDQHDMGEKLPPQVVRLLTDIIGDIDQAARQPQERGEAVANAGGLLPCPFCGDDDCQVSVMQEGESGDDYSFSAEAQCVCGATGPEAYASCQSDAALSAINTWNRRAHFPADDARVAELEAQLAALESEHQSEVGELEWQLAASREREGRMREALEHYEDALLAECPDGATGCTFVSWNKARAALAAEKGEKE